MIRFFLCIAFLVATPAFAAGIDKSGAAQLLMRRGFTPTPRELREFAGLTPEQAARRLLDSAPETARTPAPLTENMTLFWQGHFANGEQKARNPVLLDSLARAKEIPGNPAAGCA